MALTKCGACGGDVEIGAATCPKCGKPVKKTRTAVWVIGGLFGFCLFTGIGTAMGTAGVVVGVLGLVGSGYFFVKGPPERKKLAIGGVVVSGLLVMFGFVGAAASKKKAETEAATVAGAEKKAADDKARLEKAVGQLAALDASATSTQTVAVCAEVLKLSPLPAQHAPRCGDAFLAEGQAQLAEKKPVEAIRLLEQASKHSARKDEVQNALRDAKVAVAIDGANRDLAKAEEARGAKQFAKAAELASLASKQAAEGLQAKGDDADLKTLAEKASALSALTKKEAAESQGEQSPPAGDGPSASQPRAVASKWQNPAFVRFKADDERCPDEFWAVHKSAVPGKDEFEARENQRNRPAVAKKLRETIYVVELEDDDSELSEFDFKKKQFTLTIPSQFMCNIRQVGGVEVALNNAKVVEDRTGMMRGDNRVGIFGWKAAPLTYALKMTEAEAKKFRERYDQSRFKVEAAFVVTGSDEHRKTLRGPHVGEEDDAGAGTVIRTKLQGIRVLGRDNDSREWVVDSPLLDSLPETVAAK